MLLIFYFLFTEKAKTKETIKKINKIEITATAYTATNAIQMLTFTLF